MMPPATARPIFKRSILTILIASLAIQMPVTAFAAGQVQPGTPDPCASNQGQVAGAVIGALIGGFLGNKVGNGKGRKVATVAGALGGLALGNYIGSELDRRKCEVSKIAHKNNLAISMTDIALPANPDDYQQEGRPAGNADKVGLSLSIEDRSPSQAATDAAGGDSLGNAALSTQFRSGSDVLTPDAEGYFREIAAQYALAFDGNALPQNANADQARAVQGLRQKRILIVGHTDDTGSSRLNADLSEQRARNVGRLFADAGVPSSQVFYQGSGETQPIADNRSDSGRARNRRVEIVDLPDEQAFQRYLSSRVANTGFYRVTGSATPPASAAADKPARTAAAADKTGATAQASRTQPARKDNESGNAQLAQAGKGAKAAASPAARQAAAASPAASYDFGGTPVAQKNVAIDIGRPLSRAGFEFISSAVADDTPTARSCADDHPRIANAVKDLQGNREYHVGQYLPGLYDTSWIDTVNGNMVALTHVAVLRDGGAPARNPTVLIYKAAHGKPTSGSKADFNGVAQVNTYQGDRGLLYRVFVNGPVQCMDLFLPREQASQPVRAVQAVNSNLYYQAGGTKMVATYNPKLAKAQ